MIAQLSRPVGLSESVQEATYGGKAAQLAAALRAGLPVPDGVALAADFVEAIAAGEPGALSMLEEAVGSLRPPLAVRSSGVGEDSETASFAGQHVTRLNVRVPDGLVDAVLVIRESARSESALAYRRRLGLAGRPRMAVVVQELIDADSAGVLFTRNPIDGADEIVVEAAWGLGEAVVAGLITPDRFRIARDGAVLERVTGEKDLAVALAPEGGTHEILIPDEQARALCLDDRQLADLAGLAERCELVFGGPRDLEWAFAGDVLHLLQCRAVTRAPSVVS
jgi:pyruvate, water dikinase